MNYPMSRSSDEAVRSENKKYPFEKLELGESFFVNFKDCNESSLRAAVSAACNRYSKCFKCIKHKDVEVFEVACINQSEKIEYPISESSPEAHSLKVVSESGKQKYPFDKIPEGLSCLIPFENANEGSLRSACSLMSKRLGKKFICIKHDVFKVYELYHVPKEQITPFSFFAPSPEAVAKGDANET